MLYNFLATIIGSLFSYLNFTTMIERLRQIAELYGFRFHYGEAEEFNKEQEAYSEHFVLYLEGYAESTLELDSENDWQDNYNLVIYTLNDAEMADGSIETGERLKSFETVIYKLLNSLIDDGFELSTVRKREGVKVDMANVVMTGWQLSFSAKTTEQTTKCL